MKKNEGNRQFSKVVKFEPNAAGNVSGARLRGGGAGGMNTTMDAKTAEYLTGN